MRFTMLVPCTVNLALDDVIPAACLDVRYQVIRIESFAWSTKREPDYRHNYLLFVVVVP